MIFGLDCADVDGNKDPSWSKAKAQGPISFAIIRASYGSARDKYFDRDWASLKSLAITRGAYFFLRFPQKGKKPDDPDVQANACAQIVGELDRGDFPISVDVEFPGNGRSDTGMTAAAALEWVRTAWNTLRSAYNGVPPIIYTSGRVWREDLTDIAAPDLVESPLWLARYFWKEKQPAKRDASAFDGGRLDPPVPSPWGDATNWWIHQYQGDATGLPGFSSTVDLNRFNATSKGDKGDRVKWVQRRLGIATSGKFDDATLAAVTAHQTANGLVSDGVIGPRTFASLCRGS